MTVETMKWGSNVKIDSWSKARLTEDAEADEIGEPPMAIFIENKINLEQDSLYTCMWKSTAGKHLIIFEHF